MKTDPSFLLDCAAAIAAAPFDQVLGVAEPRRRASRTAHRVIAERRLATLR